MKKNPSCQIELFFFFTDNIKEHAVRCNFSEADIYLCFSLLETVDENICIESADFFFKQIENFLK